MEQSTLIVWEPLPKSRKKRLAGNKVLDDVQEIADWYAANKTSVSAFHVYAEQWDALNTLASKPGKVRRDGDRLFFGGFELLRGDEHEGGGA